MGADALVWASSAAARASSNPTFACRHDHAHVLHECRIAVRPIPEIARQQSRGASCRLARSTVAVRRSPVSIDISPKNPPVGDHRHFLPRRLERDAHLPFEHHEHRMARVALLHDALARGEQVLPARRRRAGVRSTSSSPANKSMAPSRAARLRMCSGGRATAFPRAVLDLDRKRNLDVVPPERVPDVACAPGRGPGSSSA